MHRKKLAPKYLNVTKELKYAGNCTIRYDQLKVAVLIDLASKNSVENGCAVRIILALMGQDTD